VILLHGLGRTSLSLNKMTDALPTAGFKAVNLDSPSHPIRLSRIRANRDRPGLRPQHLAAVQAAARVAGAQVRGDRVGSAEIELAPGPVRSGDYFFDIGTAGATSLVLQTLLLPLALAPAHRASPSAAAPTCPGAPVSTTWIGSGGQSSLASTSPSI